MMSVRVARECGRSGGCAWTAQAFGRMYHATSDDSLRASAWRGGMEAPDGSVCSRAVTIYMSCHFAGREMKALGAE